MIKMIIKLLVIIPPPFVLDHILYEWVIILQVIGKFFLCKQRERSDVKDKWVYDNSSSVNNNFWNKQKYCEQYYQ